MIPPPFMPLGTDPELRQAIERYLRLLADELNKRETKHGPLNKRPITGFEGQMYYETDTPALTQYVNGAWAVV